MRSSCAGAGAAPTTGRRTSRSRRGCSCRARSGRSRSDRSPRADRRGGARWPPRARALRPARSQHVLDASRMPGRATGSRTCPTSGNDCSHTGSWTITGVTSQQRARSRAHAPGCTASTKSERTNTNVPAGSTDECRVSVPRHPRASVAAPRTDLDRAGARGPTARRRARAVPPRPDDRARGPTYPTSPRSAAVEATIRRIAASTAAGLSSQGNGGSVDAHPRSPVGDHDDARSLVGEELAHHELVGGAGRRESRRRPPVDRRSAITRPVRARPGDLVTLPAARAAPLTETDSGEAPLGDERERSGVQRRSCVRGRRLRLPVWLGAWGSLETGREDVGVDRGVALRRVHEHVRRENQAVTDDRPEELARCRPPRRTRAR